MHEFDVPVYDIVINKGADFVLDIELDDDNNSATPFDMSQYSFAACIKTSANEDTPIANFTFDKSKLNQGVITVKLPASETKKLLTDGDYWKETTQYYWDMVMMDGKKKVTRICQGTVQVSPGISDIS